MPLRSKNGYETGYYDPRRHYCRGSIGLLPERADCHVASADDNDAVVNRRNKKRACTVLSYIHGVTIHVVAGGKRGAR